MKENVQNSATPPHVIKHSYARLFSPCSQYKFPTTPAYILTVPSRLILSTLTAKPLLFLFFASCLSNPIQFLHHF